MGDIGIVNTTINITKPGTIANQVQFLVTICYPKLAADKPKHNYPFIDKLKVM